MVEGLACSTWVERAIPLGEALRSVTWASLHEAARRMSEALRGARTLFRIDVQAFVGNMMKHTV